MAHFYAHAQGSRGETHRLGGKSGGAIAGVRSWNDGVKIYADYKEQKGKNIYTIVFTGGSSNGFSKELGTIELSDDKKFVVFKPRPRSLLGLDDVIIPL